MIELKNLSKRYELYGDTVQAVNNVSLNIDKEDFIGILGHSGSGKTTLLNLIGGLTKPDSGEILIDGTNIWSISDNALSGLRNEKMNFIFQFSSLIPTLTVIENVMLPTVFSMKGQNGAYKYGKELLDMVNMQDKLKSYPSQLSGGQQRRAAIARAFINRPQIIFADEPTGDLDEETEAHIMDLFQTMNKDAGITFLIVTHSSELASETKKQYRMSNGVLKKL